MTLGILITSTLIVIVSFKYNTASFVFSMLKGNKTNAKFIKLVFYEIVYFLNNIKINLNNNFTKNHVYNISFKDKILRASFMVQQKTKSYQNVLSLSQTLNFIKVYYYTMPNSNSIFPTTPRFVFRSIQTNFGFFFNYKKLLVTQNNYLFYKTTFLSGLKYVWNGIKLWIIPAVVIILVVYFNTIIKVLPLNKVSFIWFSFFMVLYWLVSGFVFFFKKYQFSKYTSVVQRFWRRSYILFWLLETCLLFVFIYLTFLASQESFFMFDQIQIYKTHLFSWRLFLLKILPVVIVILFSYSLLLNMKWGFFSKTAFFILLVTFFLTYIIWIEFYQFFHIVNFYGNLVWTYDVDEKIWNLEGETRRTRIVNNYVMLLLILKFWHLLFVYGFWLFFVLRGLEKTKIKYPLFSANHQNLIILYIMSWLYMFPWFKLYFRKFMNLPYFWFYTSNRTHMSKYFYNDLILYITNFNFENCSFINNVFKNIPFFYWIDLSNTTLYYSYIKSYIKSNVIHSI